MANHPSHNVYVVTETRQGFQKKPQWTKVGAVWPHGKGGGFDVVLIEGIAVAGRLVCTVPKEKDSTAPAAVNDNGQTEPGETGDAE